MTLDATELKTRLPELVREAERFLGSNLAPSL
jgi:hypothetical protein